MDICPNCYGMKEWQGQDCPMCWGKGVIEQGVVDSPEVNWLMASIATLAFLVWMASGVLIGVLVL